MYSFESLLFGDAAECVWCGPDLTRGEHSNNIMIMVPIYKDKIFSGNHNNVRDQYQNHHRLDSYNNAAGARPLERVMVLVFLV